MGAIVFDTQDGSNGGIIVIAAPQPEMSNDGNIAASSSFYVAMRLLPRAQREAMFAVYGFCRYVDDIADGPIPRERKIRRLCEARDHVASLFKTSASHDQGALGQAIRQFDLDLDDFVAVIEGMEMDARGPLVAPDWATLDLYCDRVASAVGRLSVKIFGITGDTGIALAHHLGRALQLTNVLRDLEEDAADGRLYLPKEALDKQGIVVKAPSETLADGRIAAVCQSLFIIANHHFELADHVLTQVSRRRGRAPRLMSKGYRLVLQRLSRRGWLPPRSNVQLTKREKVWLIVRNAI